MRAHHAPRTRPTRAAYRAGLALTTCLLVSACAGPGGEPPESVVAADTSDGTAAPAAAPDAPEAAADAAVEFFAAFDEIVLTGDVSHWADRSSPECFYCTTMAEFGATFGFSAGVQDGAETDQDETLEELGLGGFDVTVIESAQDGEGVVQVDVQLELLLTDLAPVSPQMVAADGAVDASQLSLGASAGAQPARLTMTHDGERWTVAEISRIPGSAATGGSHGPAADQPPTPPPAMAHGDVDGAVAALEHYLALEQHVYRTGEAGALEAMSGPECAPCQTRRDLALDAVAAGFEIEAGRARVELVRRIPAEEVLAPEELDPEMDKDVYLLQTRVHTTDTTLRTPDGEDVYPAGEYALRATLLDAHDGRWYVVDLTEGA
ncbi:DUF6318 family protein [Isoptericola croceus]|uniref:DUF6318 family protein n=1 Tax=Isoptericola croceus TaxID=3031406 RepID=UPI0023F754ED|nr:DUF6318 family protein [Isoptericola croceus]